MPEEIRMLLIGMQQASSLDNCDFWRALVRVSANDALLSTALQNSKYTSHKSDIRNPSMPITID